MVFNLGYCRVGIVRPASHWGRPPHIWIEGAAAHLGGCSERRLIRPAEAHLLAEAAARLRSLGLSLTGPLVASRLDLASDLIFSSPPVGTLFQRALATIDAPRCPRRVYGTLIKPETVEFLSGRLAAVSVYDRGLRTKTAPRGEWIRVERRYRRTGRERVPLDELDGFDWVTESIGPMSRLVFGGSRIIMAGDDAARCHILAYERDGRISPRTADSLLAELDRALLGLADQWPAAKRKRFRDKLAATGLVAGGGPLEPVEIPLADVLQGISRCWGELT